MLEASESKYIEELKLSLNIEDLNIHKNIEENVKNLSSNKNDQKKIKEKMQSCINSISSSETNLEKENSKIKLLNLKKTELEDQYVQIDPLLKSFEKLSNDELYGKELLAGFNARISMLEITLPKEDKCPTCLQEITSEYRNELEESFNEKMKELKSKIDSTKKTLKIIADKKEKCSIEINKKRS